MIRCLVEDARNAMPAPCQRRRQPRALDRSATLDLGVGVDHQDFERSFAQTLHQGSDMIASQRESSSLHKSLSVEMVSSSWFSRREVSVKL